ncbi:hypothetical protein AB3R30_11420 [Leptolyngbyaceae cyanobacterium UHCC 1019]
MATMPLGNGNNSPASIISAHRPFHTLTMMKRVIREVDIAAGFSNG